MVGKKRKGQGAEKTSAGHAYMTRRTTTAKQDDNNAATASASTSTAKPITRMQQPPVYYLENIMKIKMECDYKVKQEHPSIIEPPQSNEPNTVPKSKTKKKMTKKNTKTDNDNKKDEDESGPSNEQPNTAATTQASLEFGQKSKPTSEEYEQEQEEDFLLPNSDDDAFVSVVESLADLTIKPPQPSSSSGSDNEDAYESTNEVPDEGEQNKLVVDQPSSSSTNTIQTMATNTVSSSSSSSSISSLQSESLYFIPGQQFDDTVEKLKHISFVCGVEIKYAIAKVEGPEEGVREAAKLIRTLFKSPESILMPNEESMLPSTSRSLPLIPLLSISKAFSHPKIFSRIMTELDLDDILTCRMVNRTWNHMATVYLRHVNIQKPAFFHMGGPSTEEITLKPTPINFDILERIPNHPDFLLDSLILQLDEYSHPLQKLRVGRILTSIFASIKDSLTTLILKKRIGYLPNLILPVFSHLEYFELNDSSFNSQSVSKSKSCNNRMDFTAIFPENTEISSVFQNVRRVKWDLITNLNKLSLFDFLFPQTDQIFPNVEVLEFSGCILQDDLAQLSIMFPSLKELEFTFSFARDVSRFCRGIFCFMKQLESLHFVVNLAGYQEKIPCIDGALTGFTKEDCKKLMTIPERLKRMENEQLDLLRAQPCILNLEKLRYLGLTFHCCEWVNCTSKDFKNIVTIVSCLGAFVLMRNLMTVDLTICVPSDFDTEQFEGVEKALESISSYVHIRIQQENNHSD